MVQFSDNKDGVIEKASPVLKNEIILKTNPNGLIK